MPKRKSKTYIKVDGKRISFRKFWYKNHHADVTYATASARLKRGMTPLEAVETPPRKVSKVSKTERVPSNRKLHTETLTMAAIDWAVVRCKLGVMKEFAINFWRDRGKQMRVDLFGVTYGSLEFTGFEVKSCHADFLADKKWMNYLQTFDRFYLVIGQDYYESDLGQKDCKIVRAEGVGILVLMDDGYCYVKHKAKTLPGLDLEEKVPLVSKMLWKSSQINRANHTRRTKRYLE